MKFKTTSKQMRANYHQVIETGYCSMQSLLKYTSPIAYSVGVYGWNCDYYEVNGVLICTGYRGMFSKNTKHDYKLIDKYEQKAQIIDINYDLSYEVRKRKVNKLLERFVAEVIKKSVGVKA